MQPIITLTAKYKIGHLLYVYLFTEEDILYGSVKQAYLSIANLRAGTVFFPFSPFLL